MATLLAHGRLPSGQRLVQQGAPDSGPTPDAGTARLLVAARVGPPRLIDNMEVVLGVAPDVSTRLDHPAEEMA